uniref:Heparan-alpha-glucosaminide N-acetyltransferase catalytic domain-containing protein n=1 Tax=Denticeps clupeoides TaxID=299321 RepID=A0AAY4AQ59_9TELE
MGRGETRRRRHRESRAERPREGRTAAEMARFLSAALALVLAVLVAPLSAKLPSSRPHRKSPALKMDEATLTVHNELQSEMMVSFLSDHCYQCMYQQLGVVPAGAEPGVPGKVDLTVGTQFPVTLQLNSTLVNLELCRFQYHFGEQGNYSVWVKNLNDSSQVNCSLVTDTEPVNSYLREFFFFPAAFSFCDLIVSFIPPTEQLFTLTTMTHLPLQELGPPNRAVEPSVETAVPATSGRRLRSLDTFRGIALIIMVFVNYGGGRYWFFRHESWNGLTIADLVFPWFVFIMGTSIAISINGALRRGVRRSHLLKKVVWRSVQLFLIGVILINPNYCQGPLSWVSLRIPGVLQRLAFTYLVVASLDVLDVWWYKASDFLLYWPAWLCVITLEIVWLCLTFLLPVPDCPSGYLGPGGIGDFGKYPNCTGGAAGFIDRWLLGENHIYQTPSSRVTAVHNTEVCSTIPYDPEGVLGSINSILMAFLGLQAGKILLHYKDLHSKIMARFLIWGVVLGMISAVLTKCSKDHGFIPINKNLWSLSYVTTLSSFAFILLVVLYYLVDVNKWWSGAPFFYPGMNSILVYVGHEVFEEYFPFRWRMSNSQSHAEHLTQNLVATCVWVFISFVLYKNKIFWKI